MGYCGCEITCTSVVNIQNWVNRLIFFVAVVTSYFFFCWSDILFILGSLCQRCACLFTNDLKFSSRFFGGGQMEEEEKIVKGDDVIVELDATLEDLYMGGSVKVRSCLDV